MGIGGKSEKDNMSDKKDNDKSTSGNISLFNHIHFYHNGEKIYCCFSPVVPRIGEFVKIMIDNDCSVWKVQQICNEFTWIKGLGEMNPHIEIHLRRLRPGERGNLDEPTGYRYV